jgi:hypothetical protein
MKKSNSETWGDGEKRERRAVGLAVLGIAGAAAALWYLARRGEFDIEGVTAFEEAGRETRRGVAHS